MAERRDAAGLHWVDPARRGVLPLNGFHLSRSLAKTLRSGGWTFTLDTDFPRVVAACAEREDTWISPRIERLYGDLHRLGHAHSIEVRRDGRLVGGCYGVALRAAFFGESMFSRETDASKAALAVLVERLRAGGFRLLDTQFLTPHLASLGAVEIGRRAFHDRLADALSTEARLSGPLPDGPTLVARLRAYIPAQRSTQTS